MDTPIHTPRTTFAITATWRAPLKLHHVPYSRLTAKTRDVSGLGVEPEPQAQASRAERQGRGAQISVGQRRRQPASESAVSQNEVAARGIAGQGAETLHGHA